MDELQLIAKSEPLTSEYEEEAQTEEASGPDSENDTIAHENLTKKDKTFQQFASIEKKKLTVDKKIMSRKNKHDSLVDKRHEITRKRFKLMDSQLDIEEKLLSLECETIEKRTILIDTICKNLMNTHNLLKKYLYERRLK